MKRLMGLLKKETTGKFTKNKGDDFQTSTRLSYAEFMSKVQAQKGVSRTEPNVCDLADKYLSLKMRMPRYENHSRTYVYMYDLRDGFLVIRAPNKTNGVDCHFHRTFSSALERM